MNVPMYCGHCGFHHLAGSGCSEPVPVKLVDDERTVAPCQYSGRGIKGDSLRLERLRDFLRRRLEMDAETIRKIELGKDQS